MSLAEDQSVFSADPDLDAREPFGAFVSDDTTYAAAVQLAGKRGWPPAEVQRGGLGAALRQLGVVAAPDILLVDLSGMEDVEDIAASLGELAAGSKVIALGTQNDVAMFRRVMDAGACDYLVKPVHTQQLAAAVARAETSRPAGQAAPVRRGRCIAVVGARGGVGASTVAGNLAWLIASERERQTGLLDLDLQYGCQALSLDLQPAAGLREALEDPERVDDSMIDNLAVKADARLSVFAAEEAVDDVPVMPRTAVTQLLAKLRESRDVLVADLPRHLLGQQPDLLEQVTDLVIVTDLSLPGLRDCNRLIRLAKQQDGKLRVRVVANRVGKQAPGHVDAREFDKELESDLAAQLSFDPENVAKSAMAGRTLSHSAPKAKLLADLRTLLVDLVGAPRTRKRALLGFLKKG
ncbi:AAA family ATPase [Rhodovibrio salinarum]|uniref:Response regulatory domain-containing protein n=1 Tax=Rhodovibrio salinarum TaxID=1087 RepID=A0A934UYQ1_9PROT|nr:P-loop NTPase [Rhodovibrio salinarum]MBK1696282.1 hypothetical protein [Rhodovibrio salinarum]